MSVLGQICGASLFSVFQKREARGGLADPLFLASGLSQVARRVDQFPASIFHNQAFVSFHPPRAPSIISVVCRQMSLYFSPLFRSFSSGNRAFLVALPRQTCSKALLIVHVGLSIDAEVVHDMALAAMTIFLPHDPFM